MRIIKSEPRSLGLGSILAYDSAAERAPLSSSVGEHRSGPALRQLAPPARDSARGAQARAQLAPPVVSDAL